MVRLPDRERSYAVLIGASTYQSAELPNLPAVGNNLVGLVSALTDPAVSSFDPTKCTVVADSGALRSAYRTLREYARRAEDTLLVYFAGHGLVGALRHELYLALPDTDPDELSVSALPFEVIRDLLQDCPATNRVLILDCCFSGRAVRGFMTSTTAAVLGQVDVAGTYTLASTSANATSVAPEGETYTAFTGELLALFRDGIPDGPELLALGNIYRRLRQMLTSKGLPAPTQRGTDTADLLALARNPVARTTRDRVESPHSQPADDPPARIALSRARIILITIIAIAILGAAVAVLASLRSDPQNTSQSQPNETTSQRTNGPRTSFSAEPDPAGQDVALRWAQAWVNHPPGITNEEWLDGLRSYTTNEYIGELASVDPANIPANEIVGDGEVVESYTASMTMKVLTDGPTLKITVIKIPSGWRVAYYELSSLDRSSVAVRVYNNSSIKGLGTRAAEDLRESGWDIIEVGNYPITIETTTVYYTPGTEEQSSARGLAQEFGMRAEPKFTGIEGAGPGLIVIVTQDYRGSGG